MASPVKVLATWEQKLESIQTESKPYEFEASSQSCDLVDTDRNLRMLEVAIRGLHSRKITLQLELKTPGISADKERLRRLLTELQRIMRALHGRSAGVLQ
jgi:hypothetical protein